MRNEGEHFRTGVQELDKFPQGAEGFDPASAPLGAGASRRIEQGRRRRPDFYLLRAARSAGGLLSGGLEGGVPKRSADLEIFIYSRRSPNRVEPQVLPSAGLRWHQVDP